MTRVITRIKFNWRQNKLQKMKIKGLLLVFILSLLFLAYGLQKSKISLEKQFESIKSGTFDFSVVSASSIAKTLNGYIMSLPKENRASTYQEIALKLPDEVKKEMLFLLKISDEKKPSDLLCDRNEMYSMPEEFLRALSLIQQRMPFNLAKPVNNCLLIQYATSDNEMVEAEGLFVFEPGSSTKDKLTIFVSPRYKNQSDLLTAFLLSHETKHAWSYAIKQLKVSGGDMVSKISTSEDCYLDEAEAFTNQLLFISSLNEGEKETLFAIVQSPSSYLLNNQETQSLKNFLVTVGETTSKCNGDGVQVLVCAKNSFLDVVKSSSYYQKQCER